MIGKFSQVTFGLQRQKYMETSILEISKSSAPLRDEDMIAHLNRYISAFTIKLIL